jgi:hypothetical protein
MTVMDADTKATKLHRYGNAVKIDTRLLAMSSSFVCVCFHGHDLWLVNPPPRSPDSHTGRS